MSSCSSSGSRVMMSSCRSLGRHAMMSHVAVPCFIVSINVRSRVYKLVAFIEMEAMSASTHLCGAGVRALRVFYDDIGAAVRAFRVCHDGIIGCGVLLRHQRQQREGDL